LVLPACAFSLALQRPFPEMSRLFQRRLLESEQSELIVRTTSAGKQAKCRHEVQLTSRRGHWFCDICRKNSKKDPSIKQSRYRCACGCNFDLCEECFRREQPSFQDDGKRILAEARAVKVGDINRAALMGGESSCDECCVPDEQAEIRLPRHQDKEKRIIVQAEAATAGDEEQGSATLSDGDPSDWHVPEEQAQINLPKHIRSFQQDFWNREMLAGNGSLEGNGFLPGASQKLEGCSVALRGLAGDLAKHNGERGMLSKYRRDSTEYEVTLLDEVITLKGTEHLVPIVPDQKPNVVGAAVLMCRLCKQTEYNGCLGHIVRCSEENRIEVRATKSGMVVRMKPENLLMVDSSLMPAVVAKKSSELKLEDA